LIDNDHDQTFIIILYKIGILFHLFELFLVCVKQTKITSISIVLDEKPTEDEVKKVIRKVQ